MRPLALANVDQHFLPFVQAFKKAQMFKLNQVVFVGSGCRKMPWIPHEKIELLL